MALCNLSHLQIHMTSPNRHLSNLLKFIMNVRPPSVTDNRPLIYIIRIEFLDILIDRENRLALNEDRRPRRRGNDEPILVVLCCFGFIAPEFDDLVPAHDFGDEAGAGHAWDEEGRRGWRAPVPLRVAVGEFVVDVDSST